MPCAWQCAASKLTFDPGFRGKMKWMENFKTSVFHIFMISLDATGMKAESGCQDHTHMAKIKFLCLSCEPCS